MQSHSESLDGKSDGSSLKISEESEEETVSVEELDPHAVKVANFLNYLNEDSGSHHDAQVDSMASQEA